MAKKNNNVGKILFIIFMVVVALVGIGAFVLNTIFSNSNNKLEKPGEELGYDIFIGDDQKAVTTSKEEGRNLSEELKAINVTYKDAVCWLKVPGTTIDYPIFQGTTNDTYYRNDRDKKETKWGETYLDFRCNVSSLKDSWTNIIIYGHNTETDNRFTPLLNYKREEFFKNHKYIELATVDEVFTYEIFAAYSTDTSFYYIDTVFHSESEYADFVKSLTKKSRYNTEVEVSSTDKILTLSTCDYSLKDGRFVVQAKLVENP